MITDQNKIATRKMIEEAFNQGNLAIIDECIAPDGVDHQELPGTDIIAHLKQVVVALRTAFPDLHFEIHDLLADGDITAMRSTMTGTHTGTLSLLPGRSLPATGRRVSVPHMHFVRVIDGKTTDLWHLWNIPMMMQQLSVIASEPQRT
ncbi:MAG: ester cyclase [Chloroflexota bacterium]